MSEDKFRKNALTIVGVVGYFGAVVLALIDALTPATVPIEVLAVIFTASAAALNIDFSLDFLPVTVSTRPESKSTSADKEENGRG